MHKVVGLGLFAASGVLLASLVASGQGRTGLPLAGACRHDSSATAADRERRDQALALARAINRAEGLAAQRTRAYQPLASLPDLPPAPDGFRVRLHVDDTGYMFSVKDDRDPCHYGIFSDENSRLYEMSPQVPQNAIRRTERRAWRETDPSALRRGRAAAPRAVSGQHTENLSRPSKT